MRHGLGLALLCLGVFAAIVWGGPPLCAASLGGIGEAWVTAGKDPCKAALFGENGYAELMQVLFYVFAVVCGAVLAVRMRKQDRAQAWMGAGLAGLALFCVLEETSYGAAFDPSASVAADSVHDLTKAVPPAWVDGLTGVFVTLGAALWALSMTAWMRRRLPFQHQALPGLALWGIGVVLGLHQDLVASQSRVFEEGFEAAAAVALMAAAVLLVHRAVPTDGIRLPP